jgi:hypothetical protein
MIKVRRNLPLLGCLLLASCLASLTPGLEFLHEPRLWLTQRSSTNRIYIIEVQEHSRGSRRSQTPTSDRQNIWEKATSRVRQEDVKKRMCICWGIPPEALSGARNDPKKRFRVVVPVQALILEMAIVNSLPKAAELRRFARAVGFVGIIGTGVMLGGTRWQAESERGVIAMEGTR